jgi:acyl carrier protein
LPIVSSPRARLAQCFAVVFPDLASEQITGASIETTPSWDSLNAVVLVSVIEEEFGLEIPAEDIGELSSFDGILSYVVARIG